MSPHRVLVIAEAANPEWVSVPLIGWSMTRALRDVAAVHLVTQVRNREALIRAGWVEGHDFTAIDSEAIARPFYTAAEAIRGGEGKGWTTVQAIMNLSYYYFEELVWRRFGAQLRGHAFDLVHRVTPLSPTTPSTIAARLGRAGVPFVIGPLNGGVPWPKGFDGVRRAEREWLSYVRSAYKVMPGYRSTRRNAAAVIVGSSATQEMEPASSVPRQIYLPENAIDPERFPTTSAKSLELPLRVAFVGRLVPYKGVDMLIDAVRDFARAGQIEVDVYGDGPERDRLERAVGDLSGRIRLRGWVPHTELHSRLADAHVLGFPSIREFGGGVVLEAMALGVVPIVVAYAGPRELVTQATGYPVPIGSRAQIVERLKNTFAQILADPTQLGDRAQAARYRVERCFTWPVKAQQLVRIYDWVTGRRSTKPYFGMPLREDWAEGAQ